MCFDNDYDWYAEVQESSRQRTNKILRCYDCCDNIELYDWYTHIYMREHEECHCDVCDLGEDTDEECWQCFGEEFECNLCEDCRLIRHVIKEVEKEEGCPPHLREPGLGGLVDEFIENKDTLKYALRAISLYPHLSSNKVLNHVLKVL